MGETAMFFYSEAAQPAIQEQVLAAFAADRTPIVQQVSTPRTQSRLTPEFERQFDAFVKGAPVPECERHGTKDWSGHIYAALEGVGIEALRMGEEVMAAIMVYNRDIIGTGRDRALLVKFVYDPKTKTCYLPAEPALRAFNFYNTLVLPPLLKKIPQPVKLAVDMEDSHGYTGNISHRSPSQEPAVIDLMHRHTPDCCGGMALPPIAMQVRDPYDDPDKKRPETLRDFLANPLEYLDFARYSRQPLDSGSVVYQVKNSAGQKDYVVVRGNNSI